MYSKKLILFVSFAFLVACGSLKVVNSSKVDQKNIYESYTASYDQSSKRLNYIAQFRSASMLGDSLLLESGSTIKCQGKDMRSVKLSDGEKLASALLPVPFGLLTSLAGGNWYVAQEDQVNRQGGEVVQFVYKRNDNVTTKYDLTIPSPVTAVNVGSVSKADAFAVSLSRALHVEEKVECYLRSKGSLDNKAPDETDSYAIAFAENNRCMFPKEKLAKMLKGPAEVTVSVRISNLSSDYKIWTSSESVSPAIATHIAD